MERKPTWVVVTSNGQKKIGVAIPSGNGELAAPGNEKEAVLATLMHDKGLLQMMPAYEFFVPMIQTEAGEVTHDRALAIHHDLILDNDKVPVYLRVDEIYFLDDLSKEDRERYDTMIKTIEGKLKEVRQRANSRIQLVPTMPVTRGRG